MLAGALVTVAILSFVLGALALAKMRGGIARATGIAAMIFCFGLLAAQPARDMIVAAILCAGTLAFAVLLLWWRRRLAASPA